MTQRHRRPSPGRLLAAGVVGLGLVAAACGSSAKSGSSTSTSAGGGTTTASTSAGPTTSITVPVNTTSAPAVDKPVMGGKVTVGVEAEVAHAWDPRVMQCDVACQTRARTVFEPLMSVSADFGNGDTTKAVHPFLAESLTPDATYKTWTLKVRPGIKFTDGTDLNADAVVFNLVAQTKSALIGPALANVATITKADDMTVTITTKTPWVSFPAYLTGQAGFVASPKWLQAVDAKAADPTHMVGTGPFMFDSYTPGQSLIVKRNPNYWRKDQYGNQLPYLDSVELRVIADDQTRTKALEAGDIDVLHTSGGQSISDLRKQKDTLPMIEQAQFGETGYVLLHVNKPPLDDQRVRCAMSYAVDKKGLIDATAAGVNPVANSPISPGQEGFLADNGAPSFDPAKAKALVDAYKKDHAGVAPTVVLGTTTDQIALTQAQLIQANLQDVGFKTTIKQIEQSAYITLALLGDKDFQAFGWRNNAGFSIDQQYIWWSSSTAAPDGQLALNFGRMKDPKIDADLAAARGEPDAAKRKVLAEDINHQFATQCWILPIGWTIWGIAHKTSIQGIDQNPLPDGTGRVGLGQGFSGQFGLDTVWIKK